MFGMINDINFWLVFHFISALMYIFPSFLCQDVCLANLNESPKYFSYSNFFFHSRRRRSHRRCARFCFFRAWTFFTQYKVQSAETMNGICRAILEIFFKNLLRMLKMREKTWAEVSRNVMLLEDEGIYLVNVLILHVQRMLLLPLPRW